MTYKERTSEFNSIVQGIKQRKEGLPSSIGGRNRPSKKAPEKTQFFVIASQIGKDIGETAEKLDRLSKLAKKKTLFDDPSIEIQELISIINQDIKNLNNQIATLQQKNSSKKNNQVQTHSETILGTLKSKLKSTTKDFSEVLELRTENLKAQQKEKIHFTGNQSPALSARRTAESPLYKQQNIPQFNQDSGAGNEIIISMPQSALITQERYIGSRTEAVQNIEKVITELSQIFQTISTLVAEQGEIIERINDNVEDTSSNVSLAQNQLLQYLNSVSSNRWLIVKLFAVLIFFVVLFIVFFV